MPKKVDVPQVSDNAMIQWAKDYLTKRHVDLVQDHGDLVRYPDACCFDIKVWHDPDFDFWHQVRFIDRNDKTLGWIVEVCYVQGEWKLAARCLPYAIT